MTNDRIAPVGALFEDEAKARGAIAELTRSGVVRTSISLGVRSAKRMQALAEEFGATPLQNAVRHTGLFTEFARVTGAHEANEPKLADELLERGIDEERADYFDRELSGERILLVLDAASMTEERLSILARMRADFGLVNGSGIVDTVAVRAEVLDVSKRVVVENEITIRTEVVSERKVIEIELMREEVVIERRSLTGAAPEIIRLPTKHEEVVVEKHTVVTDEVIVRTDQFVETVSVDEVVRHEVLTIDDPRVGPAPTAG
ncbi:MAG: YsnF/AvaK domain-containing protein [Candidatus Velthaea sp.]